MLRLMNTSTEPRIEFVVRCLRQAMPRNWPAIAQETGVPQKTIVKIAYRETKDPLTSTTQALHDYFVRATPGLEAHGASSDSAPP